MQENINIPDSTITTNLSFRQLVLMNMQQLTNFPYIEKDFDALTDYELLSLVVKYLNDVIANQNEQNDSITKMYESFLELQTYVNNTKDTLEDAFNNLDNYVRNYFDNLNVQEEINNKLDQMLEDGVLEQIIEQFLQLTSLICFDTVSAMKLSPNLANGSYAKTLGFNNINDGGGSYYKIRELANGETANEMNVISITNTNLVAELIPEDNTIYTAQFGIIGDGITEESNKLQTFFNYDISNYIINSSNILIDDNMYISSNSRIIFNEGTKITRKATSSNAYQMLNITNKTNVEIINAHLIGDKETHIGNTGESGHGITVCYSQNITLKNCFVEYTWGDGYYLGESFDATKELDPMNYLLINCKASYCSRNGFSLTGGSNHKLINCSADHTDRTAPKTGLDIEPEGPDWKTISGLNNCEIINFTSSYNETAGIQVAVAYGPASNIIIDGHNSSHEYEGLLYSHFNYEQRNTATSHVVYKNANISACNHGIHIYNTDTSVASSLLIQNVDVNGCNVASDGRGIWYQNQDTDNGNVILDNITVQNTIGLNDFQYLMSMPSPSQNHTVSNIIVKNMCRVNSPDASHYVIACDLPNGEVKYTNCDFQCNIEKETGTSGYLSLSSYNNIYGINCTKNTTVALNANGLNPEGEYSIKFFNDTDTPAVTHTVDFGTSNVVSYGSTVLSSRYINTASRSASIKFYKKGTSICILGFTGYNIS